MLPVCLAMLLLVAWFVAPDLALELGISTSAVQYRADGIYAAALALLAREYPHIPPDWRWAWRAIFDAAALFWVAHPVCDLYWPTGGVDTASVCDAVSGVPWSAVLLALIGAAAGGLYDWIGDRHD